MAMVGVDSGSLQADSQPKSFSLVGGSAAAWRHSAFIKSSRMRVMNHNWSATKQSLHPQSVTEISRHSVLSGDRIRRDIVLVLPQ